jgi:hypothetical protein
MAGVALLGLATISVEDAAAADRAFVRHNSGDQNDDWDEDWEDAWEDYNRTLLQLQRESISSQEEQAREAERAVRREELEQNREKSAAEREAYFQAILEASQASLRAPRGVYFRKPGYTSADPPGPAAAAVEVEGVAYFYDRGIFWIQQGTDYLVVTAPAGAVVNAIPPGAVRIPFKGGSYWYFFGTFFAERSGTYAVVKPPAGLTVYYLPDGYSQEKRGAADVFRFGETLFKPVFVQGVLAYQVIAGE